MACKSENVSVSDWNSIVVMKASKSPGNPLSANRTRSSSLIRGCCKILKVSVIVESPFFHGVESLSEQGALG